MRWIEKTKLTHVKPQINVHARRDLGKTSSVLVINLLERQ
jgi:hypothetical protein